MTRRQALTLRLLALWLVASTAVVFVALHQNRVARAVLCMSVGLIVLWVFVGGALMYRLRDPIRERVLGIRLNWKLKFVLFATLLALLEEAVTVTMTNLAPVFAARVGEAYITASANYLDVVAVHSVIVFIPLFVGWAWLLSRYDFSPFAVFWLFGMTGTLAEATFGPQHLAEFGLWIFVYGLMVYLPAYTVPPDRGAKPPRWYHYPMAVVAPFLFEILVPTAALAHLLHHPPIHFPPLPQIR